MKMSFEMDSDPRDVTNSNVFKSLNLLLPEHSKM